MSLFRVTASKLEPVSATTFAAEGVLERKDLQRLIRQDISILGDDLMVLAEEYGEWEDSNRRIDLLCLSKGASLVVVEIKRTEDGGHMELQAIRYAAMVSSMTLDQAIQACARYRKIEEPVARGEVLGFLHLDSADDAELTGEVRIVLVSSDFSTELTTAVMWLNRQDLDITCIRLRPYRLGVELLIDVSQIIPLPEAADYEVKLRAQEKEKKKVQSLREEALLKFWQQTIERSQASTPLLSNRKAPAEQWISAGIGRSGYSLNLALTKSDHVVECYLRLPGGKEKTTAAFEQLVAQKAVIEATFGEPLIWLNDPDSPVCRIRKVMAGGWSSAEAEWPKMQDEMIAAMIRMEGALKKAILEVKQ